MDQSEQKQQRQAHDEVFAQLTPTLSSLKSPRERKGKDHAHDKEKERENQIIEAKTLPGYVLKLRVEQACERAAYHPVETVEDFLPACDPKHIEAAQRVNGHDPA